MPHFLLEYRVTQSWIDSWKWQFWSLCNETLVAVQLPLAFARASTRELKKELSEGGQNKRLFWGASFVHSVTWQHCQFLSPSPLITCFSLNSTWIHCSSRRCLYLLHICHVPYGQSPLLHTFHDWKANLLISEVMRNYLTIKCYIKLEIDSNCFYVRVKYTSFI